MTTYIESHFISKAKHMPFVDKDGVTIDGWVLEPKDYDPSKSYPGVLEIHGGQDVHMEKYFP